MKRIVIAGAFCAVAALATACDMIYGYDGAQPRPPTVASRPPRVALRPVGQKPFIAHYERGPGGQWDQREYSPPNFIYDSYGEVVGYDQFNRVGEQVSALPPVPLPPVASGPIPLIAMNRATDAGVAAPTPPLAPITSGPIPWVAMNRTNQTAAGPPPPAPPPGAREVLRRGPSGEMIIEIGNFPTAFTLAEQTRRPPRTLARTHHRRWTGGPARRARNRDLLTYAGRHHPGAKTQFRE